MNLDALPYQLRPHQVDAATDLFRVLERKPNARTMVVMPTGTGKSYLLFYACAGLGMRSLLLAHTDALLDQLHGQLRRLFPHLSVGRVQGPEDEVDARVVVASVQTLARRDRLERLLASQTRAGAFGLVAIDECHHAIGASAYHRVVEALPDCAVVGFTATPERLDKKTLSAIFVDGNARGKPGICHWLMVQAAIERRLLVPATPKPIVMPELDPEELRRESGDVDEEEFIRTVGRENLVSALAGATEDLVRADGRRAIVFVPSDVTIANEVAHAASERGVKARAIHGRLSRKLQRELLRAHKAREISALVGCVLLTEGYDDPSIDGIGWGRPTYSRSLYVQGVGRGLRVDPERPPDAPGGKVDCVVRDLVGAHQAHGLQTAATLGSEPDEAEALEGLDGEDGGDADEGTEIPQGHAREVALIKSFLAHLAGLRVLPSAVAGSRASWLALSQDESAFTAEGEFGAYTLERDAEGRWSAYFYARDGVHGEALLLTPVPTSFSVAASLAEEHADASGGALVHSERDRAWRQSSMSPKQRKCAQKFGILLPADASAGTASDALTVHFSRLRIRGRRVVSARSPWG